MSKRDTKKVAKRARDIYEMNTDVQPSKKQKKQKVKERQDGKKEITRDWIQDVMNDTSDLWRK